MHAASSKFADSIWHAHGLDPATSGVTSNIVAFLECPLHSTRMKSIQAPRATWPWISSITGDRVRNSLSVLRAVLPAQCLASKRRDRRWNCSAVIDAKIALAVSCTTTGASAAPPANGILTAAIRMPAHLLNGFMLYPAKPAESRFCDGRQDANPVGRSDPASPSSAAGSARWSSHGAAGQVRSGQVRSRIIA